MKKQIKTIYLGLDLMARKLAQIVIRLYQWTFSPDKSPLFRPFLAGRVCRHYPHCSQYGYECFDHYNFFTACFRTMDRISRCTPGLSRSYDPVRYRVVFASGSPIGVPFLEALAADPRYDVVGVLTMPDMPSGRGMKMQENVIAVESERNFFGMQNINLSLKSNSKNALDYIVGILQDHQFDYVITGGLAAKCYGSKRKLADIDIDVHDYHLVKLMDICSKYSKGIQIYQDDQWEINILTLDFNGQIIELCGIETAKIYNNTAKLWELYDDTLNYHIVSFLGNRYHIKPVQELIQYKGKISRRVDVSDIDQIYLTTSNTFIKKPHSLRLDSKKYADEAKDTYTWLQSLDVDILYVVAYGNLLPQHILDMPKIAPINIHGSLLPAYRGASPLQTVFRDGLTETGITLMKMEAGLDSGPMIDKQIFKLSFTDTVADLIQRVKDKTPKWSLDSIDRYVHGELEEEIQDEGLVTHCGKIEKEDGLLDIENDTIDHIYRKYKAYYLWPKIFMKLDTKNTKQKIVTIDTLVIDESLYGIHKDNLLFVDDAYTLNPAITHLQVKPEGGKSMSRDDFLRGYMKQEFIL